jgi:hypothetical protein
MGSKSATNVEVSHTETEIIEPTDTNKQEDRTFMVQNGEKNIIAIAWGLDDNQVWQEIDNKTINARESNVLIAGQTHYPRVKLTGRTTTSGDTSIVNATLEWVD